MKRLFAFFLTLCLMFSFGAVSASAETNSHIEENLPLLSSLSDEQCRAFLLAHGISVPEELNDIDLPKLFARIEENPNMVITIGWTTLAEFIEEVRAAVKEYYGIAATPSGRASAYTLQYSTLHSWNSATMPYYNCYAYAIGRTSACDPGDFSDQTYDDSVSIISLANMVKDDLKGDLGFECVKVQSSRPTSTNGWANVIAVRKDTTYDVGFNDYHFAKLSSSNWYHKPGGTAILKFNSAPSNSVDWNNECYNGVYHEPSITYDSDVMYLSYKTTHGDTIYEWTGEHYHSGVKHYYQYTYTCEDCGTVVETVWISEVCSGPPCAIHMKRVPNEDTE